VHDATISAENQIPSLLLPFCTHPLPLRVCSLSFLSSWCCSVCFSCRTSSLFDERPDKLRRKAAATVGLATPHTQRAHLPFLLLFFLFVFPLSPSRVCTQAQASKYRRPVLLFIRKIQIPFASLLFACCVALRAALCAHVVLSCPVFICSLFRSSSALATPCS